MEELIEFKRTPVPLLYKYKGKMESTLVTNDFNTATSIKTVENINECKKLTFTVPFAKDRKLDYGCNEKRVYFDDVVYIIREMDFQDEESNQDINVTCEEYASVLKNVKCENICEIARTPEQIWNAIVSASKLNLGFTWLGTDINSGILRHLITDKETSAYENLIQMASVFNGSIEFSYNEQGDGFVFLRTKPITIGKTYKDGVDLKSLTVRYDSNNLCTKLYPTGYTDDYEIVLDIQSVNGGSSLLVDKSYFQALGIPNDLLETDPQYNGIMEFNDSVYTDVNDLLIKAREELTKCCRPKITADITIQDLSQIVGCPIVAPKVSMEINILNKEIEYIFDSFIVGIERDYDNPLDTKLSISNDIPYITYIQQTNKANDIVSEITTPNPTDTDGNKKGDGTTKIIASKVVDGDHINIVYRVGEVSSQITETNNTVSLKVEEQGKSFAELQVLANSITSTVSDISDTSKQVYSQITQTARNIKAVIVEGSDGSSVELSKSAFKVAFLKSSADITTIDEFGITSSNVDGSYTRMGSKGLEHIQDGMSKPYHYLSYSFTKEYNCPDSDWLEDTMSVPLMFDSIEDKESNISISCSVKRVWSRNETDADLLYRFGGYASIQGDDILIAVQSCWKNVTELDGETLGGRIQIVINLIA